MSEFCSTRETGYKLNCLGDTKCLEYVINETHLAGSSGHLEALVLQNGLLS